MDSWTHRKNVQITFNIFAVCVTSTQEALHYALISQDLWQLNSLNAFNSGQMFPKILQILFFCFLLCAQNLGVVCNFLIFNILQTKGINSRFTLMIQIQYARHHTPLLNANQTYRHNFLQKTPRKCSSKMR